jgi:methionyl-tRNA formyltransferase
MDRGLDTGPILAQRSLAIEPDETTPHLSVRLAEAGARLMAETLPLWLRREIEPAPQGDEGATLTTQLKKEDGLIDWNASAVEIERKVRGLQPWPGTFTYWQGRQLKILNAGVEDLECLEPPEPGTVIVAAGPQGKRVLVNTGKRALKLEHVQFEGKPVIEARALLAGYPQIAGSRLGAKENA